MYGMKNAARRPGLPLVVMVLLLAAGAAGTRIPVFTAAEASPKDTLRRLPLTFEANRGQAGERVKFLSRGSGYNFFLTPREAILALAPRRSQGRETTASVLRMRLEGGNPDAEVVRAGSLAGWSNYLIGTDRSKWLRNVPKYSKVCWRDAYAGIDVVYYGNEGELEHDYIISPGRSVETVKVRYDGVERITTSEDGDLLLHTPGGILRQKKPFAYQESGERRVQVAAAYDLLEEGRVGFRVGEYDRSRPLVIDPVLAFSTLIGGHSDDYGVAIAVDAKRNTYITGYTGSFTQAADNRPTQVPTDEGGPFPAIRALSPFPTSPTPFQTDPDAGSVQLDLSNPANGSVDGQWFCSKYDAFVTRFGPLGSDLIYSTYLGGAGDDFGLGIAVDNQGAAHVTGMTLSTNFPVAGTPVQEFYVDNGDAFVAKIAPTGDSLVYATYLGGTDMDRGRSIGVDATGNVYVAGITASGNFPTGAAGGFTVLQPFGGGGLDAFVTSLDSTGAIRYSTYLGGSGDEGGASPSVELDFAVPNSPMVNAVIGGVPFCDPESIPLGEDLGVGIAVSGGSVWVAGGTNSADFPTLKAIQPANAGGVDAFLTRLHPSGSLVSSTYVGGTGDDAARAVAFRTGLVYLTGYTASGDFPTVNPLQAVNRGGTDAFVLKISADLKTVTYSTYLGGNGDDIGNGVGVNSAGQAYVAGTTQSTTFPTRAFFQSGLRGTHDVFLSRYSATGNSHVYSTYLGGGSVDRALGIAVGPFNEAYLTGVTSSLNAFSLFPTTRGRISAGTAAAPDAWASYPLADAFFARVDDAAPAAPTNLTAPSIRANQVTLVWTDNSFNETEFEIQGRVGNTGGFVTLGTVPANTRRFTVTGLTPATNYSFRVRALSYGFNSAYTNILPVTTTGSPPAAPTDFKVTPVVDTTDLLVTWTNQSSTASVLYELYRSSDGGVTWTRVLTTTVAPRAQGSFTDTGLTGNTQYRYRLEAFWGPGSDSNTAGPIIGLTRPSQPTNLTLTVPTTGNPRRGISEINLSWTDASANKSGFWIERSLDGITWTRVGTTAVGVTRFTDTGLRDNTLYQYRVRGFNASGGGLAAGPVSGTTLKAVPLAPSNLRLSVVSDVQIDLTWADNSNSEDGFSIERRAETETTFTEIATVGPNVTTLAVGGLTPNTEYTFRVRAFNNGGYSPGVSRRATTAGPPVAPTSLIGRALSSREIELTWQDNFTYESGFKIERLNTSNVFVEVKAVGPNVRTFIDTNRSPGTTYTYRVRAFIRDLGGATRHTAYTNQVRVTTPTVPLAPSNLSAKALSASQVRLTFRDNSNNEEGFKIERRLGSGSFVGIATIPAKSGTGGTVTFTDSELLGATGYTYRVRAFRGTDMSSYSNQATVVTL